MWRLSAAAYRLLVIQLELKRKTVYDAIKRIGGVPDPCVDGCIPSPSQWGYRNKASLPVQTDRMEKFIAGFYKNRSHDIVPFIGGPGSSKAGVKMLLYLLI